MAIPGLAVSTLLLLLVGACAARPPAAVAPAGSDIAAAAVVGELTDGERAQLRAYIRAIEERARRRHVEVIWVNPPDEAVFGDPERLRAMLRYALPSR